MTRETAIQLAAKRAVEEALLAIQKYPPFNSTHEGWAVIAEEHHELFMEIIANDKQKAVAEATQVAAMAIRFIAEFSE